MSTVRKRKPSKTATAPKKKCQGKCGKEKAHSFYFKVDSPLFPDGMINVCRDCVRESVDVNDIEQVISFFRQIDKPFYQDEWSKSLSGKNHPIGTYLGKINSLQQYKGKNFSDSDGINGIAKIDLSSTKAPDTIETHNGKIIEYSDDLVTKWGIGYSKTEYLQMEKYFQDTKSTHEIHTPAHIEMLTQLAYLSVDRNRLRQERDWTNYTKLSKTIEDMQKSAGFRPVDRQGGDEATGMKTFSQIWEEVERKGFRKPPPPVFNEDVVDAMIVSLANYYNRLVGKQILTEIPEEIREELDAFFVDDLTPVEINDEEYEDLDFSINDEDEDDILLKEEDKDE